MQTSPPLRCRRWTAFRWTGLRLTWIACWVCVFASSATLVQAQSEEDQPEQVRPGERIFQVLTQNSRLSIIELQTRVVELPNRIKVVDGFNPNVLAITALSPQRIRLRGEKTGVTSLTLSDEFDATYTIEVFVEPDVRELQAQFERLFPGSAIEVIGLKDSVVLRGWVTEGEMLPKIMAVAQQFYGTVHNQMRVSGVSQVQLHVKVMEVQRSKIQQLGFNFVNVGNNFFTGSTIGALTPMTAAAALPGNVITATNSGVGNAQLLFGVSSKNNAFNGFIEALQSESLLKTIAEPVVTATNGRPASLLSGGEFPVLVPSGLGTVSISWKEFGVRLEAVPVILGNGRLKLDVAPEVSDRDFSNSVNLNGLVVPGIVTRRVNTSVEMQFGDTLMIGGLISQKNISTNLKVPFLGDLPWVGGLFSRKKRELDENELLIMVTPHLAGPLAPDQVPQIGPGYNTEFPSFKEWAIDQHIEIPRYGPDSNLGTRWADDMSAMPPPAIGVPTGTMHAAPVNGGQYRVPAGGAMPSSRPGYSPESLQLPPEAPGPQAFRQGTVRQTSGDRTSRRVTPADGTSANNPFYVDVKRSRETTEEARPEKKTLLRKLTANRPPTDPYNPNESDSIDSGTTGNRRTRLSAPPPAN